MVRKYDTKWFIDQMRYLDIDVSTIESEADLAAKMKKARWKKRGHFGVSQTAALRGRIIDIWSKFIKPLRNKAVDIERETITKIRGGI